MILVATKVRYKIENISFKTLPKPQWRTINLYDQECYHFILRWVMRMSSWYFSESIYSILLDIIVWGRKITFYVTSYCFLSKWISLKHVSEISVILRRKYIKTNFWITLSPAVFQTPLINADYHFDFRWQWNAW